MSLPGYIGYSHGFVADQTQLLQTILNGLSVYNSMPLPFWEGFLTPTFAETSRVPQGPLGYTEVGDGTKPEQRRLVNRLLTNPLRSFDCSNPFTRLGIQDALPGDIENATNAAILGDQELQMSLIASAIFTKRTAGAVEVAYQPSFYNGETDVPPFGQNTFASAHSHYAGINTTTLARTHIETAIEDVAEHGFAATAGELFALFNPAQLSDLSPLFDPTTGTGTATPNRALATDQGFITTNSMIAGAQVVISSFVPSGYFAIIDRSARPIARRQHINPAYRGLMLYSESETGGEPIVGKQFQRRVGFVPWQLGAAAVRQIVASTTYTNPTLRYS